MLWMLPHLVVGLWLRGLLAITLLIGGGYLLNRWYRESWVYDASRDLHIFAPDWGWNWQTAFFATGLLLIAWTGLGFLLARLRFLVTNVTQKQPAWLADSDGRGNNQHAGHESAKILTRPDGAQIHVELSGNPDAPAIVFTHGWGLDRREWSELKSHLGNRFRLITWDLPGLGRSTRPSNNDYSLEALAGHLAAVVELAGDRPVTLVGHSIGGMITLTLCRCFPGLLQSRIAGLVIIHSTYTDPTNTTRLATVFKPLERPLLVPLLHATIWLAPIVWLLNWMSYLNGSLHRSTRSSGFAGHETWEQLDWASRRGAQTWPGVAARGMLGMIDYEAGDVLGLIPIPTLVVAADQDPLCTPEASRHMAATIPGAELQILSPAKHMGLIEHHETLARLIERFVGASPRERIRMREPGRSPTEPGATARPGSRPI